MFIVDAHLDLAYNAMRGRDLRMPARDQPVLDKEIATVGFPDLRAGGVGLVCATIFCWPTGTDTNGYTSADEARIQAKAQLGVYINWISQKEIRFVRRIADLPPLPSGEGWGEGVLTSESVSSPNTPSPLPSPGGRGGKSQVPAILLLEGADALRTPDDVQEWFDAGLRIVGLAWHRTRFAGGTGAPGPLTDEGRALVREMDRFGIIHDASHLAEESFWQMLDLTKGPVIASHSNCRAIVEGDRQLSDEMIRAIIARGGVIGINFYDKFLIPKPEQGTRRANLDDVIHHIHHICDLAGNASHVGLGTDMDGGLGREQIPVEIQTSADLPKISIALTKAGFKNKDINAIMGQNWRTFFVRHLPNS